MSLTAYASLKTIHWIVFRALGAPNPFGIELIYICAIMQS